MHFTPPTLDQSQLTQHIALHHIASHPIPLSILPHRASAPPHPPTPCLTLSFPALYDPLAFVAVSHATLERFLEVSAKLVNGTEHLVVGSSSEAPGGAHPGVRDATLLRSFLLDAFSHSLTKTFEHVQVHILG